MVNTENPDKKIHTSGADSASLDKIDQLPLSVIPLKSNSLKNAKLLKNSRMETVVELYNDPVAGSLQVPADENLNTSLGLQNSETAAYDTQIIQQLSQMNSFDIFSMRHSLHKIGLDLNLDNEVFQLSPAMKKELQKYAHTFTAPLLRKVYGLDAQNMEDFDGDLNKLFQNPDKDVVRRNLTNMAKTTGMPLTEIPDFIQNYSDIYQSVAYYRYTYDAVVQDAERFLVWINKLVQNRDVASMPQTMKICTLMERDMRFILGSLKERFDLFRRSFQLFWQDINANSFEELKRDVSENYNLIGAVLCAVVVKIDHWAEAFPNNDIGSPTRRAKFVMTDLAPGVARVRKLEEEARQILGLSHK